MIGTAQLGHDFSTNRVEAGVDFFQQSRRLAGGYFNPECYGRPEKMAKIEMPGLPIRSTRSK